MVILTKKIKRQKNLIFVFLAVLFITALVWWYGFFRSSPKIGPTGQMGPIGPMGPMGPVGQTGQMGAAAPVEEVKEIDFSVLEGPFLKELQPFEEIESFKGEIGRENPFIPY